MAALGFVVLMGAFGLNFAAGQFFVPLSEAQGWTLGVATAAAALNTALSGLAQPPIGRLIDRHGPRLVIATSLASMGLAYVAMSAADKQWQLLLAYGVLGGVGFAGCSSLAVTVLLSRWYQRGRTEVLPRVFLGINAGQLTLVPLSGLLIDHAGYRSAYLVLGLVVLALVVPLVALFMVDAPSRVGQHPDGAEVEPAPGTRQVTSVGGALRSRPFWLATLAFGANGFSLYFALLHLPRLASDLGGAAATGGRLLALAAAASALTMLAVGPLVRRLGKRRVTAGMLLGRAIVLVAAAGLVTTTAQLHVVAVLFGVVAFPVIPLAMGLITERFGTHVLGGVLGLVFVSHQLFAALGVLAGGLLRDAAGSYDLALVTSAGVLLAGVGLLIALGDPPTHPSHDSSEEERHELCPEHPHVRDPLPDRRRRRRRDLLPRGRRPGRPDPAAAPRPTDVVADVPQPHPGAR